MDAAVKEDHREGERTGQIAERDVIEHDPARAILAEQNAHTQECHQQRRANAARQETREDRRTKQQPAKEYQLVGRIHSAPVNVVQF